MRFIGLLCFLITLAGLARAEPCMSVSDLRADHDARFLAGTVRGCVDAERYEDAIQMFWAYSNYGLFDQQRVWDESAHVVLQELHVWIFSGYGFDQINALKAQIARLRAPDSPFLAETCKAVAAAGPPDYRPDYLIKRGMMPRKTEDDWLKEGFDAEAAWQKALVEVNGCPLGTV